MTNTLERNMVHRSEISIAFLFYVQSSLHLQSFQKGWVGNLQENVVQFLKVLHYRRERIGTEEPLKKKGAGKYNKLSIGALRRSHGISGGRSEKHWSSKKIEIHGSLIKEGYTLHIIHACLSIKSVLPQKRYHLELLQFLMGNGWCSMKNFEGSVFTN